MSRAGKRSKKASLKRLRFSPFERRTPRLHSARQLPLPRTGRHKHSGFKPHFRELRFCDADFSHLGTWAKELTYAACQSCTHTELRARIRVALPLVHLRPTRLRSAVDLSMHAHANTLYHSQLRSQTVEKTTVGRQGPPRKIQTLREGHLVFPCYWKSDLAPDSSIRTQLHLPRVHAIRTLLQEYRHSVCPSTCRRFQRLSYARTHTTRPQKPGQSRLQWPEETSPCERRAFCVRFARTAAHSPSTAVVAFAPPR